MGAAHPSPAKAQQFREIDLKSCPESLAAALANNVKHFVYVSVAHPAPTMKAYIEVRTRCEELIRTSGLHATILRPWYVRRRRWNSNRGSPRDTLATSVKLIGTSVSANRSFPQALTAESRTDPCQGRSLRFPLLQVHGHMGESFQLTP